MARIIRELKFKDKIFFYDEENRLVKITKIGKREDRGGEKEFYDKEEDMPPELIVLIEETLEEMHMKECIEIKEGSAEQADEKGE